MGQEITIVENNVEKVLKMSDEAIVKALTEMGMVAEASAKGACPVDTGLLRNSITTALDGAAMGIKKYKADKGGKTGSYGGKMPAEGGGKRAVYIGTNVEYAPYIENGTSRMAARPFLLPSVQNNKDKFVTIIKKNMKNA